MGEFIDGRTSFGRRERRRHEAVKIVLNGLGAQKPPELVRKLDRGIDNGEIDYDQAILLYDEGALPAVKVEPVVDPNQMIFIGLDTPPDPTLYQRWLDHTKEWRD